jgi:hypothetical protein
VISLVASPCGEKRGGPDLQSRNWLVMEWLGWSEPHYVGGIWRVDLYLLRQLEGRSLGRAAVGERPSLRRGLGHLHPRSFLFPRLYQSPVNPDRVTHDLELGILPFPSTIGTVLCHFFFACLERM